MKSLSAKFEIVIHANHEMIIFYRSMCVIKYSSNYTS